jgi:magnesium transporter
MIKTSPAEQKLIKSYSKSFPAEIAYFIENFSSDEIYDYLKKLPLSSFISVFSSINPDIAADIIPQIDDEIFAQLFPQLDEALSARLLSRLDNEVASKKLDILEPNLSKQIKYLMEYPPDTAGYLMDARVTTFHPENNIGEVLKRLRMISNRSILNIFVVDIEGNFIGSVPLQVVAVTDPNEQLKNIIQTDIARIDAFAPREEIVQLLEEKKIFSLPVVDVNNKLLGILRHNKLVETAAAEASENALAMFGAGRDERALSKVSFAIRKRLPWLEINLVTAFLAAAVVGMFEETIAKLTVLAVFLPVVAGQSGNTGSQALAVTIRGLALREFSPSQWFKVARKEIGVGFVNGVAVSLTTSVVVFFWASSLGLAIVIAVSMVFSMVIAGFSGAVIPIILKSLGQDPAQSSSIILTTVTDVVGFLSFLGLATIMSAFLGIA